MLASCQLCCHTDQIVKAVTQGWSILWAGLPCANMNIMFSAFLVNHWLRASTAGTLTQIKQLQCQDMVPATRSARHVTHWPKTRLVAADYNGKWCLWQAIPDVPDVGMCTANLENFALPESHVNWRLPAVHVTCSCRCLSGMLSAAQDLC